MLTELCQIILKVTPGLDAPPARPETRVIAKTWESPVNNGSYLVGFVDYSVRLATSGLYLSNVVGKRDGTFVLEDNNSPKWEVATSKREVHFEVKTRINSLGELFRQLQTYRFYLQHDVFVVVSPDDRFQAQLHDQGFRFVKYPH